MSIAHQVSERLKERGLDLARYLLPNGMPKGSEWCVGSIHGEPGLSLKFNIDKGVWKDFATGQSGDCLDLWDAVRTQGDRSLAMKEAAEWLGDNVKNQCSVRSAARVTRQGVAQPALKIVSGKDDAADLPDHHPTLGKAVARWIYSNIDGEPVVGIYRFDRDGGKFFQQYVVRQGWIRKNGDGAKLPDPTPLYRLDILARQDDAPVVIVEGEKTCDALSKVGVAGVVVTTTIGGAQSPHRADLTPLAGRQVVLWRDADEAGEQWLEKIVATLREAEVSDIYAVNVPPDVSKGWDAADAVAEGWSRSRLSNLIFDENERLPDPDTPEAIGFTGNRLLALLDRPAPAPIEPGIPAKGHLNIYVGLSFSGKSTLSICLAMARAAGVPPWSGVESFEPGRVLIFSLDESPWQVMHRIKALAKYHPGGTDLWVYVRNIVVIGPDREVDAGLLDGLRFDVAGLAKCKRWLRRARAEGQPFCELYIDAYADFLPPGESENSNETATRIGGALERIAVETETAIALVHHAGKPPKDSGELDVRDVGRGASALAAKARVIFAIDVRSQIGANVRRIRTRTNLSRTPPEALFQVCEPDAGGTEVSYFRPYEAASEHAPTDQLKPGEEISTRELARRIHVSRGGEPEKKPSAAANGLSRTLRDEWEKAGLIKVSPGPRRSKMMRLRDDLCS
jgi:5S rRNA maturation endonuclease (ribonuclease M5)